MRLKLQKLGLFLVTVLAATTLVFAYRGNARQRFDAARDRLFADCTRWTHSGHARDVCQPDVASAHHVSIKVARSNVERARASIEAGDDDAAMKELTRALDAVRALDREGTPVPEMMGAMVLDEALDVIEKGWKSPRRAALVASLLEGRDLLATAHPLEGQRLYVQSILASMPNGRGGPKPFYNAMIADAMTEEDAVTAAMEHAILAGDAPRCAAAAKGRSPLTARYVMGEPTMVCVRLVRVVHAGKRLERVRDAAFRASLRASRSAQATPARIAQVDR